MGKIKGLLFFQGESDAYKTELTPDKIIFPKNWDVKFISFVLDIRRDLNQPDLPVIFAQLGINGSGTQVVILAPETFTRPLQNHYIFTTTGINNAPEMFINWEQVKKLQKAVQLSIISMITNDDL